METKEREILLKRAELERNISECRRESLYNEEGFFPPGLTAQLAGLLQARYGYQGMTDLVAVFSGDKHGVSVQIMQPWRYDDKQRDQAYGFARGYIEAHRTEIDEWRQAQERHETQIQRSSRGW